MMNLSLITPEITIFSGALIILMLDVFLGKKIKNFFVVSHFLALSTCALALVLLTKNFIVEETIFNQMFKVSALLSILKSFVILLLAFVIMFAINFVDHFKKISAEFLALLMIAACGGMILISANDFLVFYLAIELQALCLYLLATINRDSGNSVESGIKYFILGCLASGLLLYGISMIYGYSGTTNFSAIADLYTLSKGEELKIPLGVIFGFTLVTTAMFFKISAAPFHMWSPDVYQGAPTISTLFFATIAKFSVIIALLNLFINLPIKWVGVEKIFIFCAILSLLIGSLGAIFQKNIKRLLAYSSIGHIGFILLGIGAFNQFSNNAVILYAITYAIISMGLFGFLTIINSATNDDKVYINDKIDNQIFEISSLSGLAKTNPIIALWIAILLFSSAGIPPLAGFFTKFYIISFAIAHQLLIPAIIAILFSVISVYYYLKIVKVMYFDEPANIIKINIFGNSKMIIALCALLNLGFIAFLDPLVNLIKSFS